MFKIYANVKHAGLSSFPLFFLFIFVVVSLNAQEVKPQDVSIQPNKEIQSLLKGLLSTNEHEMLSGTEEAFRGKLEQLRKLVKTDTEIISQLLYFSIHAKGMKEAMLPGVIIEQMKIPKSEIATALLPIIETEDKTLREKTYNWLGGTDKTEDGQFDFSCYESFLREKKENPPQGLIRYMYNRNPQTAVVTVARVYGKDVPESEVVAKAKSGVKESVEYFSARSEWWAHFYVAEIMKKNPELRDPEIIKKLEKDKHPLIQESLSTMMPGKQ